MFLINKTDELILTNALEHCTAEFLVLDKNVFFKRSTPKKIAHHCYHNNILFHWSHNNYYFKKAEK